MIERFLLMNKDNRRIKEKGQIEGLLDEL